MPGSRRRSTAFVPGEAEPPRLEAWTADELEAARATPQDRGAWVGLRYPLDEQDRTLGGVDLCAWMDSSSGEVLSYRLVSRGSPPGEVSVALREAILHPEAPTPTGRPESVAVTPEAERADVLTVCASLGIAYDESAGFEIVDDLIETLTDDLLGTTTLLRSKGATSEQLEWFFEAAQELWRTAPWKLVTAEEIVRIDGLQSDPVFVSIYDEQAGCHGLTIVSGLAAMREFAASTPSSLQDYPVLHVLFVSSDDCGPVIQDEAVRFGWEPPAEGVYPLPVRADVPPPHGLASPDELDRATLVLELISQLPFEEGTGFAVEFGLKGQRQKVHVHWPVSMQSIAEEAAHPPKKRRHAPAKSS